MLALSMKLIKLPYSISAFLEFTDHIHTTLGKGHFTSSCQSFFKGAFAHSCSTLLLKSKMHSLDVVSLSCFSFPLWHNFQSISLQNFMSEPLLASVRVLQGGSSKVKSFNPNINTFTIRHLKYKIFICVDNTVKVFIVNVMSISNMPSSTMTWVIDSWLNNQLQTLFQSIGMMKISFCQDIQPSRYLYSIH